MTALLLKSPPALGEGDSVYHQVTSENKLFNPATTCCPLVVSKLLNTSSSTEQGRVLTVPSNKKQKKGFSNRLYSR